MLFFVTLTMGITLGISLLGLWSNFPNGDLLSLFNTDLVQLALSSSSMNLFTFLSAGLGIGSGMSYFLLIQNNTSSEDAPFAISMLGTFSGGFWGLAVGAILAMSVGILGLLGCVVGIIIGVIIGFVGSGIGIVLGVIVVDGISEEGKIGVLVMYLIIILIAGIAVNSLSPILSLPSFAEATQIAQQKKVMAMPPAEQTLIALETINADLANQITGTAIQLTNNVEATKVAETATTDALAKEMKLRETEQVLRSTQLALQAIANGMSLAALPSLTPTARPSLTHTVVLTPSPYITLDVFISQTANAKLIVTAEQQLTQQPEVQISATLPPTQSEPNIIERIADAMRDPIFQGLGCISGAIIGIIGLIFAWQQRR